MPLPKPGSPWPVHGTHTEKLAEWSAWYSGDPDQLATFYEPRSGHSQSRPAQYAGGVVGRLARWWWGQPVPQGEQRTKLHVPLAADLCGTSADLLFSEPVKLGADDKATVEALGLLQDNGLDAKLHEAAEVQAALGGVYLRTVWDETVSPLPWTDVAHPDGAIPEWRNGRLQAVTLWQELPGDGSKVHRLFERHEPGGIMYALYVGTGSNVGKPTPVQSHPEAAYLADLVTAGDAILDGYQIIQATGVDRLAVTYVPNMLPNRQRRRSPEGRSDLSGVEPLMDALDEAYSGWWRDIRLAKSRIHVADTMMQSPGPGQPAHLNLDAEVYVPVPNLIMSNDAKLSDMIVAHQFAIRVQEHRDTCEAWAKTIIESAGYSTQSLSSDTGGAVTAAEVHSHERRSYMTRGKKVRYWTAALRDHLRTQVEVANANLGAGIPLVDLSVEFQDGVQESPSAVAGTLQALRNAEAASTETRVQILNPDWDAETVQAETARILAETGGAPVPDPERIEVTATAPAGDGAMDPAAVKARADALGILIRAGVESAEAAQIVGLGDIEFTGAMPVSLRLPEKDAATLEDA